MGEENNEQTTSSSEQLRIRRNGGEENGGKNDIKMSMHDQSSHSLILLPVVGLPSRFCQIGFSESPG